MKTHVSLLAAAMMLTAPALFAQTMQDELISRKAASTRFVPFDGIKVTQAESDSLQSVISSFYYDQFRHFDDPDAPYFMFMSRDAKLSMGIGGKVKLLGWYEWGGALDSRGLAPAQIPMPENPNATRHLGADMQGSAIFFRVIGRNSRLGYYQIYIEGGFSGYKGVGFKLKKAYATVRDFTLGYATSTFCDPSTLAPDVDAQGSNSQFDISRVLVRYMPTFAKHYTVALSVEYPTAAIIKKSDAVEGTSVWLPDVATFVQYQWRKGSHVRLSAIYRNIGYRDLLTGTNVNKPGWGVQLSATGNVCKPLKLFGQVNYGRGMAGLIKDLETGGYDVIADGAGSVAIPRSLGWAVGAQYNITPGWLVSAQASGSHMHAGCPMDGSDYKRGLYVATNMFYNITSRIQVGAQFTWGERFNYDGYARAARRAEAMASFSF